MKRHSIFTRQYLRKFTRLQYTSGVTVGIAYFSSVSAKATGDTSYDYDLVVIGGGSGGLACAKHASDLGVKVALFDYVKPSPYGTKWGLGGTCVNVGCIPKKVMHQTALLGVGMHDARALGWEEVPEHPKLNWQKMITAVNSYVKSLNWGYRVQLKDKNIDYFKAIASFTDPHTIAFETRKTGATSITAKNIVIATGGRPHVPDIPGKELAITSDDIFWKKENPGKTLCVGASYISLETAGFLNEFGCETDIMVRSILLRGFDRECADLIGQYMAATGCNFKYACTPDSLEKTDDGKILVTYTENTSDGKRQKRQATYDTVLFATGRTADTAGLNLEAAGVKTASNGKFDVVNEATNVPHIFAIGDVVNGRQELTPVAIQAGTLLAKRLFTQSNLQMDYQTVPTTVFTPLEYGACGLGEEEAKDKYGAGNIEVYWKKYVALELAATHREDTSGKEIENPHMSKLIVNTAQNDRVIGFHYLGPNAGEVTQGFALAMKLGVTKADIDNSIGIHPTTAENFTTLDITKSSGKDANASGC